MRYDEGGDAKPEGDGGDTKPEQPATA